jgi:glucose-6-phosphate-specific signal transduction histidine kinase
MGTTLKHRFALPVPFDEFRVWAQQMRPTLAAGGIDAACLGVLEYVCTELLNNIVDHSGATSAEVAFDWNTNALLLHIDGSVGRTCRT